MNERFDSALVQRHRLSVSDFRRMAEAGILGEDDRVELIEGELIDVAPIDSRHAGTLARLAHLFVLRAGEDCLLFPQNPVALSDICEPQPDIALLKPRDDDYRRSLPCAADVLLLVDVGDSSLDYDRDVKLPLYARHGIPEVWLVDARNEVLEVYREPAAGNYGIELRPARDERIAPLLLPQAALRPGELFR